MPQMRLVSRDLIIAGVIQLLALLFAASTLDMGQWMLATERLSAAFWFGVIIVLVRRHNTLTRGDHRFLRFGLLAVLLAGIPITLAIWAWRGDV